MINGKKRKRCDALIVLGLVLWAAASVLPSGEASAEGSDAQLTIGVETIRGFDAIRSIPTISTAIVANAIMEPLFYLDKKGELIPALGLGARPSADGKTWTVTLRRGVTFHDGDPFTADAVVAHWKRILDPGNRYRGRMYITPVVGLEKADAYTVRFKLKHPWPPFKAALAWNRSFTALIPSPRSVAEDTQHTAPSGTGPFRFVEWKRSDHVTVEKNPNYWDASKPATDTIVFRNIPDHQTRYASLQAGGLDLIYTDRGSHIVKARKDRSLAVYSAEDSGAEIIVINNAQPPLDDVRVRKALIHAWDQSRYLSMSYKDTVPVVENPFGNTVECTGSTYLPHDIEAAKGLLTAYGKPVRVEYLHTNSKRGREAGQILQQLLKAVGIEVTPVTLDIGPIVQKVVKGNYQLSSWRIPSAPDMGPTLYAQYHSLSPANYSNYVNAQMDELLEKQRRETDPGERRRLLCRIAARINDDAVTIYRGGRRYHFVTNNAIRELGPVYQGVPLLKTVVKGN